jgi:hypothetical protein
MMNTIIDSLKLQLESDIQQLGIDSDSWVTQQAKKRLLEVAHNAPHIMAFLAEPWLHAPVDEKTWHILKHTARIHLYARILDDALDENLPIHRRNLLRAQTLFWESTQALADGFCTEIHQESRKLIAETILAAEADDAQKAPEHWGAKNHHLLLLPLLLSNNSIDYCECKPGLSMMIALLQAGDEWRQGDTLEPTLKSALIDWIGTQMDPSLVTRLYQCGWPLAARRMAWNARQLVNVLSN